MILGHDADRRHPCPDDHAALAGVVSRLRAPRQLGCGSPVACWRRLRDWQHAGCISYCSMSATATANSTGGRHSRRGGPRALGAMSSRAVREAVTSA
jgi:hypothetical protein